ncbi:uncharacterized protein UV8b_06086 [Ustilaginoidea virens]|uniref:Uncharacterized protein n=1 Tax=Ustilaginoidea virens TaxID=1159556 RepID=A0A8E5HUG6_USTVR|nr:uncharacterized protein UV8b_06086 [Ustilaginoidea virens]QUC21845.1 hypothetical protein UV8b_06086 [Ustilaginoidea virens]
MYTSTTRLPTKCLILMELEHVWDPQEIVDKLKVMDHMLFIHGCSLCGPEEIERDLAGTDVEAVSFCFKQLFLRTGGAWTKLAISNNHRGPSRTIAERGIGSPFVEGSATSRPAADCLSSVVDPGRLQQNGQARTVVETGINATPKKPITIQFER